MWRNVYAAVKQGKKVGQSQLVRSTLLPKSVVQMIGAGEESGRLGEVLEEVSGLLPEGAARRDQDGHEHDRADDDHR